jgi:hypothetical protein
MKVTHQSTSTLGAPSGGCRSNDVIKVSGEMVIELVRALGTSDDEILGLEKPASSSAPIKNRRLYRQLQNIDKLPKRDQQALLRTIDAFLSNAS